jgi:hypothetical protein
MKVRTRARCVAQQVFGTGRSMIVPSSSVVAPLEVHRRLKAQSEGFRSRKIAIEGAVGGRGFISVFLQPSS